MKNTLRSLFALLIVGLLASTGSLQAQIEIEGMGSADDLVNALLNKGIEVTNIELNCPETSYGIFEAEPDVGIGLSQGIVLTSGSIDDIPGPNNEGGISFPSGGGSDPFLDELLEPTGVTSNDACVLQIDLVPCGEILTFNYVFGSDEYNEYACSNFNDIFAFLISGPNPAGGNYENENIALIPGTSLPVAINTVNNGQPGTAGGGAECVLDYADLFVDNEGGSSNIEYDGFTVPLTAIAMVVPDETYTLYLAIADASDSSWDSGVFIEAGSLSAQFIDIVIEPTVQIDGVDNLVEGCINGTINFQTSAPASDDIIINYTLSGSAENGVDYGMPNGDPLGGVVLIPTGANSATVDLTVFTDGIVEGIEDVIISIMDETDCSGVPVSVSLAIQDELSLTACCNSVLTLGESADLTVTGGNGMYTWSPDNGTIDDINSANPTVTPTQTTVYTVTSTIGDCELIGSVTITIGGCESDAGTVTGGGLVCSGSNTTASASGQSLEADDVLTYALHNSPSGNPGDAGFELYELSASGVFNNAGTNGAPYNMPVYISAVVGNDNGQGVPDLTDPCLSVSPPVEVILLAPITLSVAEICDGATGDLSVEIFVEGGAPGYAGQGEYTLSGTSLSSVTAGLGASTTVSLGVITGQTYTFSASDANGCQGSFTSGQVECVKNAVELTTFDGVAEAKANHIFWTTATETDNDYFTLQRSFDGLSFEDISQIDGAGNSEVERDYGYFDYTARDGYNFYRLKSTEFSGITEWSKVIMVNRVNEEAQVSFNVYPIPAQDELIVQLQTGAEAGSQISIVDVSGKYLLNSLTQGDGQMKLNVSSLAPGLYFVVLEGATGKEVLRFIKE